MRSVFRQGARSQHCVGRPLASGRGALRGATSRACAPASTPRGLAAEKPACLSVCKQAPQTEGWPPICTGELAPDWAPDRPRRPTLVIVEVPLLCNNGPLLLGSHTTWEPIVWPGGNLSPSCTIASSACSLIDRPLGPRPMAPTITNCVQIPNWPYRIAANLEWRRSWRRSSATGGNFSPLNLEPHSSGVQQSHPLSPLLPFSLLADTPTKRAKRWPQVREAQLASGPGQLMRRTDSWRA